MKTLSVLVLITIAAAAHVDAQVHSDSLDLTARLRAVRSGTVMRVHTSTFGWVEGPFQRADSLLVIGDAMAPKRVRIQEIDGVFTRSRSGATTGAAIGAAVGGVLAGSLLFALCQDPDSSCGGRAVLSGAVIGGFIGLFPGVVIGAAMAGHGTWSSLYP